MELSIVILNYQMKRLVRNCLRSLYEQNLPFSFEVIVVDNHSEADIADFIHEEFPSVRVIASSRNGGMGAGNNIGIKAALGKYVLVLNPDIFVLPESIDKLYGYLERHRGVALVAPRLLNPDRSLQYTCYRWHSFLMPLYRRTRLGQWPRIKSRVDHFLMKDFDHELTREVPWCQGSCFAARREVLDQIGHFDEKFFMYFEDTDLCRRIWATGHKVVYHGEAVMIHVHMKASEGGFSQILTNRLTRAHITSWLRYLWKYRRARNRDIM